MKTKEEIISETVTHLIRQLSLGSNHRGVIEEHFTLAINAASEMVEKERDELKGKLEEVNLQLNLECEKRFIATSHLDQANEAKERSEKDNKNIAAKLGYPDDTSIEALRLVFELLKEKEFLAGYDSEMTVSDSITEAANQFEALEMDLSELRSAKETASSELKEARELLELIYSSLLRPAILMKDADSRDWVQPKCDELFCELHAFLAKSK